MRLKCSGPNMAWLFTERALKVVMRSLLLSQAVTETSEGSQWKKQQALLCYALSS